MARRAAASESASTSRSRSARQPRPARRQILASSIDCASLRQRRAGHLGRAARRQAVPRVTPRTNPAAPTARFNSPSGAGLGAGALYSGGRTVRRGLTCLRRGSLKTPPAPASRRLCGCPSRGPLLRPGAAAAQSTPPAPRARPPAPLGGRSCGAAGSSAARPPAAIPRALKPRFGRRRAAPHGTAGAPRRLRGLATASAGTRPSPAPAAAPCGGPGCPRRSGLPAASAAKRESRPAQGANAPRPAARQRAASFPTGPSPVPTRRSCAGAGSPVSGRRTPRRRLGAAEWRGRDVAAKSAGSPAAAAASENTRLPFLSIPAAPRPPGGSALAAIEADLSPAAVMSRDRATHAVDGRAAPPRRLLSPCASSKS